MLRESAWTSASRCGTNACVEVRAHRSVIFVRDAKDPTGPQLSFEVPAWRRFCVEVRRGAFHR